MGVILTLKTFLINTYTLKISKAFRVLNKNPSACGTGIEFDVGHHCPQNKTVCLVSAKSELLKG